MLQRAKQSIVVAFLGAMFCCLWLVDCASAQTTNEPGVEVRTINGLRQRRLFDLAVSHANSVLTNDSVSNTEKVDVAVAQIDTLAQKAYQSAEAEDWNSAREVAADLERRIESPRKILISVQGALVDQLRIERWVREVETETAAAGTREKALGTISGLVTRLGQLQSEAKTLLNRRPSPREEAEWFSANELLTLRYNLEYQQARALQHRAALYDKDQDLNRSDVLALVEQQLNSVLQSVGPGQPVWWSAQADRIAVATNMKDFRKAAQIYSGLPNATATDESRSLVAGEWIRSLTAAKKLDAAVAVAGKEAFASDSPRLDLARVELFVAMAGDTVQADVKTWQQRALDLTRDIEQTHGSYWGRLANLSVVGTIAATTAGNSNLDLLIRLADEAQRKKQWPEAIKALDTAYAKAADAGQTEIAWKLGFRAASIEQSEGRHENAVVRYDELARNHVDWPEAHTAYLMACWNLTRIMKGNQDQIDQYELMLDRLIETWPKSSSANQARLWLASIRRAQKNWPSAISLLLATDMTSPLFGKAAKQLRQIMPRFLNQKDISDVTKSNVKLAVVDRFFPLLEVDSKIMPANWPDTKYQVVLQLSELAYLHRTELPGDVSLSLQQVISQANPSSTEQLQALALNFLRSPDYFKLSDMPEGRQQQLEVIYRGLLPDANDPELADRALKFRTAVKMFSAEIEGLPEKQKKRWTSATIDSLSWSNEIPAAIILATDFATRHPKDAAVQIRFAELLTQHSGSDAAFQNKALSQWRKIASASRKNSKTWFRARYQVARLMVDQGQNDEALKRLEFIRAIPPGWRDAPNAADFDELYRSLGKR